MAKGDKAKVTDSRWWTTPSRWQSEMNLSLAIQYQDEGWQRRPRSKTDTLHPSPHPVQKWIHSIHESEQKIPRQETAQECIQGDTKVMEMSTWCPWEEQQRLNQEARRGWNSAKEANSQINIEQGVCAREIRILSMRNRLQVNQVYAYQILWSKKDSHQPKMMKEKGGNVVSGKRVLEAK